MHISNAAVRALTAFGAVILVAGCSGGNPRIGAPLFAAPDSGASRAVQHQGIQTNRPGNDNHAPSETGPLAHPATRSFFNPAATGKPLIFVSDISHEVVDIFLQAKGNAKVGQIIGDIYGPTGLATDGAGDIYIPDNNSGTIVVFAPPYTTFPKLTLDDTGNYPEDVAVSARGLVAVANSNPSVSFYRKNSTKSCATVSDPSFGGLEHDTFDAEGNLFVDGENGNGFVVGEIRGGCNATTIERLSTGNVIGSWPGAIKIDKHDRIAIEDGYGAVIYTYNRPVNGSLGNPVTTTPLTGAAGGYNFAFRASGDSLYVADYLNGAIEEYAYPNGGSSKDSISVGNTEGVAVMPPLVP